MGKRAARGILVVVAGLWIVTIWALSVGAVEPSVEPAADQTTCVDDGPDPIECPEPSSPHPSASGSTRPPSGSSTSSRPPSSSSPSPTPTSRMTTPPGSSPSPTSGTEQRFGSRISIDWARGDFFGRVRSGYDPCERRRRVALKKKRDGKDVTFGTTTTNRRGRWRIALKRPRGRYYAVARRQVLERRGSEVVCERARSKTIRP